MFQIVQKVVTFGASITLLSAINGVPERCAKITVEPDSANTHVVYAGSAALVVATGVGLIKQVAKPTAADAVLDNWTVESNNDRNSLATAQFAVQGTLNEKCRVTFYVA